MLTKTVSLTIEAYDKLRRARRYPGESFTQVILRGEVAGRHGYGGGAASPARSHSRPFVDEELDAIVRAKTEQRELEDKWTGL